jgi:peptidoglycan hydrolase-like protein with peptidoglycan-binding domain
LGHLEPITEIKGVKQRLQNLGYDVGEIDGDATAEEFVTAIGEYQAKHGLEASGRLGDTTREKLETEYGC